MFRLCSSFNQPLDRWDTSNIKKAEQMFDGCIEFNQDISMWNLEKCDNHYNIFKNCNKLSLNHKPTSYLR